jgi:hypothetical protein
MLHSDPAGWHAVHCALSPIVNGQPLFSIWPALDVLLRLGYAFDNNPALIQEAAQRQHH